MKKYLSITALTLLLFLGQACKKNTGGGGGTNPGGGGHTTKKWLIKSVIGKYDATKFSHIVIKYDDTGRILHIGYGLSGITDTFDVSEQSYVDYSYDSIGRLKGLKQYQSPGFKFVWLDPYSVQFIPDPFYPNSDPVGTFNFNGHGHLELDSRISYWPPGTLSAGTSTDGFAYSGTAVQSETYTDDKGKSQDLWAFTTPGSDKSIPNPFVGTSLQQRLAYYTCPFGMLEVYDMLGDSWSNGTIEYYSYGSGTKKVVSHSMNTYRLNADGLVVEVAPYVKEEPNGVWHYNPSNYITYEQH